MDIKAYIHHKRAEKYCDCQDCFGIDTQNNRIAISDGMSQSIFPQWWAKILVDAYLQTGIIPYESILPYQKEWQKMVQNEINRQETEGKNPWLLKDIFAERSGAGATLCGIEWNKNGWTCQCLGDSCLIIITDDCSIEIVTSQKGRFNNHPDYLDSFDKGRGIPITEKGNFNLKAILLVSDPFAELFQSHQSDTKFINERLNEIDHLSDHTSFVTLVENWRDKYNLHNDDSTLVILNKFRSANLRIIWKDCIDELCEKEQSIIQEDQYSQIKNLNNDPREEQIARAQLIQSTINFLKFCPADHCKSKGKIYVWIKDCIDYIVDALAKKK